MDKPEQTPHPPFIVGDRFDQIILLRILRHNREIMNIRLLAIGDLVRTDQKIERRGELINLRTELESIDGFISELSHCVGLI